MIDNLDIAICIFSTIAATAVTCFFTRAYFTRKLLLVEAQLKQKCSSELVFLQELQKIQIEKEQLLMRTTHAETKLVMANVAVAEMKETAKQINEQIKLEFGALAQQILDNNAKKVSESIGYLENMELMAD